MESRDKKGSEPGERPPAEPPHPARGDTTAPLTAFDKLWLGHCIAELPDGRSLVHIDRHLVHDLSSPQAFAGLRESRRTVRSPERTFAIADHIVSTEPGRGAATVPGGTEMIAALERNARDFGIRHYGVDHRQQGIVHVVAPELGLVRPGMTVACGDSHTCTLGALGAWAWGIGTSEVEHILATQTLAMRRPASMRLTLSGSMDEDLCAKDLALYILRRIGVRGAAVGFLEFAGTPVTRLGMEGRMTLCNMAIEAGARAAFVAVDDTTLDYLRPHMPDGGFAPQMLAAFRDMRSDSGSRYDTEHALHVSLRAPQVSWGTTPDQAVDVAESLPLPRDAENAAARLAMEKAYQYMGLKPGTALAGVPVQKVFIGSCTNGRLSDLVAAARIAQGRHVAAGVRALVVAGSKSVLREAQRLGLDRIFLEAGFEWREPGCSMCIGMNADRVEPGERCVSTTNRNFEGRQGPGARTHLASPATAAASAIAGAIADHRNYC
jgi:3-isopropylmalate/(R)-2-methylmalate dehydratase large subunit